MKLDDNKANVGVFERHFCVLFENSHIDRSAKRVFDDDDLFVRVEKDVQSSETIKT